MWVHGKEYEAEVRVEHKFRASHSLPSRPELHEHIWEVEFSVTGPIHPESGMVIDMLDLSKFFEPYVMAMDNTNLHHVEEFKNKKGLVGLTAKYPTCDTLAHYFLWRILPDFETTPGFEDLSISRVMVRIREPDAQEIWGYAVIQPKREG
jgi:6-pyruvoyl-tetrahydropterin synthase